MGLIITIRLGMGPDGPFSRCAPRRGGARIQPPLRGLERVQLSDERVAPGDGVGVEVLEGESDGPKACTDAQVNARHQRVWRIVLARDVLDQARAPAHGVRAPCARRSEGGGRAPTPRPSQRHCVRWMRWSWS
jgi:hypothetical protein